MPDGIKPQIHIDIYVKEKGKKGKKNRVWSWIYPGKQFIILTVSFNDFEGENLSSYGRKYRNWTLRKTEGGRGNRTEEDIK